MASRKKKKSVSRTHSHRAKKNISLRKAKKFLKKTNPQLELAKALNDLTKIFPRKTLARQFRIKPRQVSLYKKYKKRKPLSPKKQRAILRFYKKLQESKHKENLRYSYRAVGKDHRLVPVKGIAASELKFLLNKYKDKGGIKAVAKLLGKSEETILRWKSGRFHRIQPKNRERLYKARRKAIRISYDGIFYLGLMDSGQATEEGDEDEEDFTYSFIAFYPAYFLTKQELEIEVRNKNHFPIRHKVIKRYKKFTEDDAKYFIEKLPRIKHWAEKTSDMYLYNNSREALSRFIDREFNGKTQERLTDSLFNNKKKGNIQRKPKDNRRKTTRNRKAKISKTKNNGKIKAKNRSKTIRKTKKIHRKSR